MTSYPLPRYPPSLVPSGIFWFLLVFQLGFAGIRARTFRKFKLLNLFNHVAITLIAKPYVFHIATHEWVPMLAVPILLPSLLHPTLVLH